MELPPKKRGGLKYYDRTTHLGLFNLPKYLRKAIKTQKTVNRDDKPLVEKYPGFVGV